VLRAVILSLIVCGCYACSGAQKRPINWRDDMERWFSNNSTRPNETPRNMWTREEEDLLQLRVGSADYAAIGTFRLVSIYSTFSSPKQLALAFRPQETLHGKLEERIDKEGELMLQLTPSNSEDFRLAVQLQKQLPGNRYIVFLKEQPTRDDRPLLRWALYGDDKDLQAEIRAMYQWLEQEKLKKK
jgi:hypothetical protein